MKLNYDALQELYDTLLYGPVLSSPYAESPIDRAFRECDEKLSESIAFDFLKRLQDRCDNLEKELDAKSKENADLSDRNAKLQRNFDRINHLWTSQIQENMELRSKITNLQREKKNYETIAKERADLLEDKDAWQRRAEYAEKELDLAKRNKDGWRSRAQEAEKRLAELLEKKYDHSMYGILAPATAFSQGQKDLWDMLQNVNDSQPNEFDVECESMEDIIGMDLEDFLVAYKKWQEQKETDRMRNWLIGFCDGRVCEGCPLESTEYKCGCGYSFKKANPFDTRIIPDEDIKRYYEKARGDGDATFKPEKEEHQLEYGDAVRVPWKSYDYMYIGPEGKHIRLFDPKTHTVVVVSVRDNLTYQGCKIILCDEDDIRKIWKDKK